MADLHEMILRARLIFSNAPKRLEVLRLINGSRSTKDISQKLNRSLSSIGRDIQTMCEMEIVKKKLNKDGDIIKKIGATVYEKHPFLKHIPESYYIEPTSSGYKHNKLLVKNNKSQRKSSYPILPAPSDILEMAKAGETHLFEFKGPGTSTEKITKEIAGFVHTKNGGVILYGIDDDGSIVGSDKSLQEIDQSIHNSVQNTISPSPLILLDLMDILGTPIIVLRIKAWDRKTIYQYTKNEKYYVRKGTNVFAIKPDEMSKLSKGYYIDE